MLDLEKLVREQVGSVVYECGGWQLDVCRHELRFQGTPVAVGSRGLEVLEVLARAGGELVNKYELMGAVWPGAVVEENTLQFHISALRKTLGVDRTFLKTVSGRGYRLVGSWTPRIESDAAPRADNISERSCESSFETNLPLSASQLVGRGALLEQLFKALSLYRVVTLTGPGGIGKSVLATEIGRSRFPDFGGDCWLVELAPLVDASLVPSAVAHVLGLRVGGDEISLEVVAHAIGQRKLLLILDNCEHLVDAAAKLAETVVRICPNVSVLATSREVLRIEGEYVYHVPPLDVPPIQTETTSDAYDYSAVQLFLARMQTMNLGVATSREDLNTIAALCRSLDGIPLAIEFAAARSATLGLDQVAARLDDRFRLLTAGRRTALARHQTLRATLDWSYELLPETERHLLRRLAIFVAGFTLDAAVHVMHETGIETSQVVEGIANLVTKSLVVVDGSLTPQRWRLLETIRAYALQKAAEAEEIEVAARRHAEFFQEELTREAVGIEPELGLQVMAGRCREIDNVRAALDWSFSAKGDERIGISLTAEYAPVWLHLALMAECRDRTKQALDRLKPASQDDARLQMQLYIGLGTALVFMMGSVATTRSALNKSLKIAESLDDYEAQLRALWALWLLQFNIGETRLARDTARRFCNVARRDDDLANVLVGDRLMGASIQYQGWQSEAGPYFERVLQLYVSPKDQHNAAWFHYDQRTLARSMLARVLWLQGRLDQAVQQAEKSVEEAGAAARGLSLLYPLAWAVFPIMLMIGNLDAAEKAVRTLKIIAARHNATWWKTLVDCLDAKLLIKRGEFRNGVQLLQGALRTFKQAGWTVCYPEFSGALAEGVAGLGQTAEALETIDRALVQARSGGECWYVPELLRIKAELLIQADIDQSLSSAERCLNEGLDSARVQGALFWELRCALGLARLEKTTSLRTDARQTLAEVYGKFARGLDAADLQCSRALLDELSQDPSGARRPQ